MHLTNLRPQRGLPRAGRLPRPRSLAGQLFAMQVVLVALVVAGCAVFTYLSDRIQAEDDARHRAAATAAAIADSPSVLRAIATEEPTRSLQPYAERVRRDTGVTFVTIMDPDGVRWTHPEPGEIGRSFLGHTEQARRGETFSEVYEGTLGPSVRVVTPIRAASAGADGKREVVGLVSAGIAVEAISEQVAAQMTALLLYAAGALVLGGAGTYLINRRLRRHTRGMNAQELNRMHDYQEAALHAVREGLLMLDGSRRVALINDGARELLGLREEAVLGRGADQLGLPAPLVGALLASEPRVDEVHLTAERVVVVNTSPVAGGERRGTVVTLRDHTELQALAGELDSARGLAEALRAQAHEAANRLHTVVSLVELGRVEEAVEFATEELELAQELTDRVVSAVAEPVLAALLLGKAAQANEHGVELVLTPESGVHDAVLPPGLPARDLVTVLGNLIDNAVEATVAAQSGPSGGDGRPPRVTVTIRGNDRADAADAAAPSEFFIRVCDTGTGLPPGGAEAVFARGWSTKQPRGDASPGLGRGIGLALVQQTVRRHGGSVVAAEAPGGGAEFTVRLPLPAGTEVPA